MAFWNCNGTLWSDPAGFLETYKGRDMIFYMETHESPERGLPIVKGYRWESVFRKQVRWPGGIRGSGGVAVLYKSHLASKIEVVERDEDARFIWIKLDALQGKPLFIAACYFPPDSSPYANDITQDSSFPYAPLEDGLIKFSTQGEVLLLGDFNGRTGDEQAQVINHDGNHAILSEIDPATVGLERCSADQGNLTRFGKALLELGTAHNLVIYNGMRRWPGSEGFTCFPHGGGFSVVDYLIGPHNFTHRILDLLVPPPPLGADHAYVEFSIMNDPSSMVTRLTSQGTCMVVHFDHDLDKVYNFHLGHHWYGKGDQPSLPSSQVSVLSDYLVKMVHEEA